MVKIIKVGIKLCGQQNSDFIGVGWIMKSKIELRRVVDV
jgi:hypothetical protein